MWGRRRVKALVGECRGHAVLIGNLIRDREIRVDGQPSGYAAWGQYLDDGHRSPTQWGLYGSSAAVQILATLTHWDEQQDADQKVATEFQVAARVVPLPENLDAIDPLFDDKREKGDFASPVKLAFVIEALRPDDVRIPRSSEPAIFSQVVANAVDGEFWTTRQPEDPGYKEYDRVFPTATMLYALRRYECAGADPVCKQARRWLAGEVLRPVGRRPSPAQTPSMLALVGLALNHPYRNAKLEHDDIGRAIEHCRTRLLSGFTRERRVVVESDRRLAVLGFRRARRIVLDRPVFIGFSTGETHDYIFLHPEIVVALFLLDIGNPPVGRRFVLDVVSALLANIDENDRGFMGQSEMLTTVDQLWVCRLLHKVDATARLFGLSRLQPRLHHHATFGSWWSRAAGLIVLLGAAGAAFVFITHSAEVAAAEFGGALILAVVAALAIHFISKDRA
jgi:hypothetical protein